MNDRKFSLKAEHVLRCAQAAAGELGHGYVGCEHLLLDGDAFITDPVTTTDELIPSGETSSYRSNPLKLA